MSCEPNHKNRILLQSAIDEYSSGNYENAEKYVIEYLEDDPSDIYALLLKGKILFFKKEFENASATFEKAASLKQENIDAQLWYLRSLIFSGNYEKADAVTDNVLKENSEDWRFYFWKAQIKKITGELEDYFSCMNTAELLLQDSAMLYQEFADIWEELGLAERSSVYKKKVEAVKK